MFDELLENIADSINKINKDRKALKQEIKDAKEEIKELKKQKATDSKTFDTKLKSYDVLTERLDRLTFDAKEVVKKEFDKLDIKSFWDSEVQDYLESIPKPKDGKDATVDYNSIFENITKKVNSLELPVEKVDYERIEEQIKKQIALLPKPKDGKDGKDGVGIKDVKDNKMDFILELTNGQNKKIKKPMPEIEFRQGGGLGGGGASSIEEIFYTNLTPVPEKIGGVEVGTMFDNVPLNEVLDMILYPYLLPAFTSFFIDGMTTKEVGEEVPAGVYTFRWSTSRSENIEPNTIAISEVGGTEFVSGAEDDGIEPLNLPAYVKNTTGSQSFKIKATNTDGAELNRTYSIIWQDRIYYGESPLETLDEAGIKALRVSELSATSSKTYSMNAGDYKWICYPVSMGLKTTFKNTENNFDVAMEDPLTISITNAYGVTQDYYAHRSFNTLGGAVNIQVS